MIGLPPGGEGFSGPRPDRHDGMDAPREPGPGWLCFSAEDLMMDVKVIGVDIAKRYFQVHGVGASGAVTIWRKISRDAFSRFWPACRPASLVWRLVRAPIIGRVRARVSAMMSD